MTSFKRTGQSQLTNIIEITQVLYEILTNKIFETFSYPNYSAKLTAN